MNPWKLIASAIAGAGLVGALLWYCNHKEAVFQQQYWEYRMDKAQYRFQKDMVFEDWLKRKEPK